MTVPSVAGTQLTQISPATSWAGLLPAGVQPGDLLVGLIVKGSTKGTISPPPGWQELVERSAPSQFRMSASFRIADGSEGSTATWSHSSATSRPASIAILRIQGQSQGQGSAQPPSQQTQTGSGTSAVLPITNVPAQTLVLAHAFSTVNQGVTDPAGYSPGGQSTGLPGRSSTAFRTQVTAGTVGGEAFSVASGAWCTALVTIPGAAVAPVVEDVTITLPPGGASWTFAMPAVRPDGQLYVLFFDKGGSSGTIVPDPAWVELTEIVSGASRLGIYTRIGASEPAAYTFSGGTSLPSYAHVVRVSGVGGGGGGGSSQPVPSSNSGTSAQALLQSATAAVSSLRVALMAPAVDPALPNVSFPVGFDQLFNVQSNDVGGEESILVGTTTSGPGTVGGEVFTIGSGAVNWATIQLLIS